MSNKVEPFYILSKGEDHTEAIEEFLKVHHTVEDTEKYWACKAGFITGYEIAKKKFETGSIEWLTTNPKEPGKYLVETRTMMGNTNRLESYWNGKSWSFTNQTFVKYLKEE